MKERKRKKRLDPNTLLLIRQVMVGLIILIFITLLIVSIWYGTRIKSLTISGVEVTGGETIDHELIKELATAELEGSYLGIIPKRFAYLYPKQHIESSVYQINRIKDLTIKRDGEVLHISLEEYVPDALWCKREKDICLFVDETGFAYAEAPSLKGGSFLRLDKLGVESVPKVQMFDTDIYDRIKELVSLLEQNGWYTHLVEVDVADDAYLTIVEGGELKVALGDEPEKIVDNLLTVLSSPEFSEIRPGNFEYIDLRFGNKVFVNEFEPEPEPESEVASTTEDGLE